MMDAMTHAATRAAFGAAIDLAMHDVKKHQDTTVTAGKLIDLGEKVLGSRYTAENYAAARNFVKNPDSKWMQYIYRAINELDPHVLKMNLLDIGYESMFAGYNYVEELRKKYDCNMPWIILFDPTSACNMHCTGCWSAEYGHKLNLTYEDMDSIVSQGKELGVHWYMMTGGEPLCRKADILKLAAAHQDCAFHLFTNATLIDEPFCEEVRKVGNITFSVSLEGFAESNDGRRGDGHFQKVMDAFDLMKRYGLLYGTSICYTSANYKTVTSDEFLDMIIEKGCRYTWYFHYMPVGNNASTDLLLNPEQRAYMYRRVREIRGFEGGKPIFAIDFQNDGEFVQGCIAGGKQYCHINPAGDVEPCVFIHYSSANIHDKTLLECLQQPLFLEYHKGQPFNGNHLQPCPMLENPQFLEEMVARTGAVSTDLESPEEACHLCGKCGEYAKEWAPMAEKLWNEDHQK